MILSRFSMSCGFGVPFPLIFLRWRIDLGNSYLVSCASSFFRLSVAEMWTKMVQHITNNAKKRRLSLQGILTCERFIADFQWSLYCFLCYDLSGLQERCKYLRSKGRSSFIGNPEFLKDRSFNFFVFHLKWLKQSGFVIIGVNRSNSICFRKKH